MLKAVGETQCDNFSAYIMSKEVSLYIRNCRKFWKFSKIIKYFYASSKGKSPVSFLTYLCLSSKRRNMIMNKLWVKHAFLNVYLCLEKCQQLWRPTVIFHPMLFFYKQEISFTFHISSPHKRIMAGGGNKLLCIDPSLIFC